MGARKVSEKEYPGLYRSVRVRTPFYLNPKEFWDSSHKVLWLKKIEERQG
jgi:hypothetical protein